MKVLILTNNDAGLYKFRKELIERLTETDEVILSLPNGEYVPELQKMGCKFIDTPFARRGTNPFQDLNLYATYKQIINTEQPDIVLTYTIKPNIYGGLAAKACRVPLISTVTGLGTALEGGGLLGRLTMTLYLVGLSKACCVFFQNDDNRNFFIKHKIYRGHSIQVPGSGVNLAEHPCEAYPANDDTINLLFIGRIMKDKGIDELLDAATQIKREFPHVNFTLIGPFDESYQNKIMEYQARQLIRYCGVQTDVHSFIKDAHAVVLPSYHEGMANVLLEAAACGRPVIASRVPGCLETFDEGVRGIGCQARQSASLIEAIERFIHLPYDRKIQMGLAGREKMTCEFNRQTVVDAYIKEIKLAVGGN